MTRYQITHLQSESEFHELLHFVSRMAVQQTPFVYALPGDLDWWRRAIPLDEMCGHITIWRRDGSIVGFGWISDDQVDSIYDDSDPNIWSSIVAYFATPEHRHRRLWALSHQTQRQAVLTAFGYRADAAEYRMHAIRPGDAPVVSIPAEFAVRHVDDSLIESRAACQRSAFNSTKMTNEIYHRVRRLPSYTAQWDRVLVNRDEMVVAFCTIWVDSVSGCALFEPVGCHLEYQRRGLTRALICQSLRDLAKAGVREARVLSVSDRNEPAVHLYRSCGFLLIDELVPWRAE
jgi:ribosomal protein S18 acetylase RimI-like enzyme